MKVNKEEILDAICSMSLIEIIELIDAIEKKFGITSANYKTLDTNNNLNEKVKEKTEFNLYLKSIGSNKIAVIKIIRSYLNLGLKESKDLVESCPILIKEKVSKKELDVISKSLKDIGAQIEIK